MAVLAASRAEHGANLRADHALLTTRAQHLDALLGAAKTELAEGSRAVAELEDASKELETAQKECCKEGVVGTEGEDGVDHVVQAGNPLHAQVFALLAEDAAIEDTLYFVARALQTEGVDVADYLKHIRGMARKQFVVRALLGKARAVAGL